MKKTIFVAVFAVVAALSLTDCRSSREEWYKVRTPVGCQTDVEGTVNTADCLQCVARLNAYNSYYNYCMD